MAALSGRSDAKDVGESPITVQNVLDVCEGYGETAAREGGWCEGYLMAVEQQNFDRIVKRSCPPPIVRTGVLEPAQLAFLRSQVRRKSEPAARLLWEFHLREYPCQRK
jgi:hypothetical protein